MKKVLIGILGMALLCAAPVSAQTGGRMSHDELMKWAADKGACGTNTLLDATYLPDGRVYVSCGIPRTSASAQKLGGFGGGFGPFAGIIGAILVIAALGSGNSTNSTN